MMAVFENEDLLGLILQHADLAPREFVWASRVNKTWHAACFRDGELALQAARRAHCLTKRALMGLLALHSHEADRLPRATRICGLMVDDYRLDDEFSELAQGISDVDEADPPRPTSEDEF